ncbi:MAG TPA: hypothetical protein VF630_08065 [Hymenobacter sp.]|jgi:hypothetical protein
MKTKSLLFAFSFCVLLLSGCAATVGAGTDYGYYPPVAQPYYAPVRPYYYPHRRVRPVVVVPRPYYRQPYRAPYNSSPRHNGNSYRRQEGSSGSYGRGSHGPSHGRSN